VARAERGLDSFGDLPRRLHDAGRVLRAPVLAVGPPAAERTVAEVHVGSQPGLAERARRLLLAGREGPEGRGGSDERGAHNLCKPYNGYARRASQPGRPTRAGVDDEPDFDRTAADLLGVVSRATRAA
jgi:hypothetical protein